MSVFKKIEDISCKTDVISGLEDRPQMTAPELKAKFDEGAGNLKQSVNIAISQINENIDELNSLIVNETGESPTKVMSQKAVTDAIADIMVESGAGDMSKAIYDKDGDGVVDNSLKIEGLTVKDIMLLMNPVGTIKMTTTNINPSEYIGGTWERWSEGRFPLGLGKASQNSLASFGTLSESDLEIEFVTPEATSGTYNHKLTVAQMPSHEHSVANLPGNESGTAWVGAAGTAAAKSRSASAAGGGSAHNNMPPYTTCYMWKRTA